MTKQIGSHQIYIAPGIIGYKNHSGQFIAEIENSKKPLDLTNIDDKIKIFKRQVEGWFFEPAENLLQIHNSGFVILMICLSYIEGIEQIRKGESSKKQSTDFFVNCMNRIFPGHLNKDLKELYSQARCGLFHDGMVGGKILISRDYLFSIKFTVERIFINPERFLNKIKEDFSSYLKLLKTDIICRKNFDRKFSNTDGQKSGKTII